jgi:hypothetical protein
MVDLARIAPVGMLALVACSFHPPGTGGDDVGGDGAVATTDWWQQSFLYRAPIIVTTTSQPLDAGYAVMLPTDTAALVGAGHATASGTDWRIVRHTGGDQWQELDRWIDDVEGGGWNTAATRTWFRLPVSLSTSSTDDQTYVYYGAVGAGAPPGELDNVFLFGDDFEAGLGKWTANNRGETVTADAEHRGGQSSFKFITNGTECAGMHRDLTLPVTRLMFSHYLRQAQTSASFGVARGFETPYAMRAPTWVDAKLRLGTELDSGDHLQVWADLGVLDNWFTPVGVNTWHKVETEFDVATDDVRVRADGGAWFGPFPGRYRQGTAIASLALEGEGGQAGTFWLDNFVIRPFVEPEPTATLGSEQQLE